MSTFDNLNNETFYLFCFSIVAIIFFILGHINVKYRRWAIQNSGEALAKDTLEEYCKNKVAHLLNNITLQLKDGSTTQIDHILISTKGIFVIETKHYSGWIFGNSTSKIWTKVIYRNKYQFQNPIFQNYKHVKAIQHILEFIEPRYIVNLVVFTGDSKFMTDRIKNVCNLDELISVIENYPDGVLSLNRVQFCVGRLEYLRLELTKKTDVEHQEYLMQKFG